MMCWPLEVDDPVGDIPRLRTSVPGSAAIDEIEPEFGAATLSSRFGAAKVHDDTGTVGSLLDPIEPLMPGLGGLATTLIAETR
jgi:hypothetical protein